MVRFEIAGDGGDGRSGRTAQTKREQKKIYFAISGKGKRRNTNDDYSTGHLTRTKDRKAGPGWISYLRMGTFCTNFSITTTDFSYFAAYLKPAFRIARFFVECPVPNRTGRKGHLIPNPSRTYADPHGPFSVLHFVETHFLRRQTPSALCPKRKHRTKGAKR